VHVDLDTQIRQRIYDFTLELGRPPKIDEIDRPEHVSDAEVRDSLRRLEKARTIVLQPITDEILMAPPFSAVPTPFVVESDLHRSYANCAWDALGVPVMMHQPARVRSACACCGRSIVLDISPDAPPDEDAVVHFAIPAARWWADIVFT
jgi:hypothetical protein